MKGIVVIVGTIIFLLWILTAFSDAQPQFDLSKYTCREFLKDLTKPSDPGNLLRSILTIGWATGYIAAQQKEAIPQNAEAISFAGKRIGQLCRATPNKTVVHTLDRSDQ